MNYRPNGAVQFTSDLTGDLSDYAVDPFVGEAPARGPIEDEVEVLIIGGGFSALLTSARFREAGVASIRMWNRAAIWAAPGIGIVTSAWPVI